MNKEIKALLNALLYQTISVGNFSDQIQQLVQHSLDPNVVVETADVLHELSMFKLGFLTEKEMRQRLWKIV